ncbi:hypothetical protein OG883_32580 [Streptomyces sp. NBC_01142]|uniref:hypothetical protein n=1 Tax=Streptomyces sp. NBC_01142 TaxID=2975865 RepID=UPI00224CC2A5|nr:hypothetical protein [Streptomyces sp. NBC_01142]MCX4824511.1 hypothetical protein [Streptomyces sp. NBC_01142]
MIYSLIAAFSAAALALVLRSALGLSRAGNADPSAEAHSVTLALYGCLVALVALGLMVTLM